MAVTKLSCDVSPSDDDALRPIYFLPTDDNVNTVVCLGSICVWDLLGRLGGSVVNHNIDFVAFPDDSSIVLSSSLHSSDTSVVFPATAISSPSGRTQALLMEHSDAGRVLVGRREGIYHLCEWC